MTAPNESPSFVVDNVSIPRGVMDKIKDAVGAPDGNLRNKFVLV
jgi:hypothetical protein